MKPPITPKPAPRVSILLPTYNARATLPRALASLTCQTYSDWELIIVDDGSTDGTADWLTREFAGEPRFRPVRRSHAGIVSALNAGLEAARGEFVARMDADDESLPDRLAQQVAFLDTHPEVGVVGSLVEFGGDAERAAGYAAHLEWLNSVVTSGEIEVARFVEAPFAHPSVLFRRELVESLGGYREGPFPEDYELWLRWLEAGVVMAKVPETLLRWHDPPNRLSRTDPRYSPTTFYQLKAPFLARWLRAHVGPERRIVVWGAGRLTRRRVDLLRAQGVVVDVYLDIDPRKQGRHRDGRLVLDPTKVPAASEVFVLGYVANRGARELQRAHLEARLFVEGRDFLMVA